jgi:hypothetical protein
MTPTQAASLITYVRMILDPFATDHVVKWLVWLINTLAVAMAGGY